MSQELARCAADWVTGSQLLATTAMGPILQGAHTVKPVKLRAHQRSRIMCCPTHATTKTASVDPRTDDLPLTRNSPAAGRAVQAHGEGPCQAIVAPNPSHYTFQVRVGTVVCAPNGIYT